jgi:hypothetical protein
VKGEGVFLPLEFACNSATPDFYAGARLDDLPLNLVRANDANDANDANRANGFRGVQVGVTRLRGCTVVGGDNTPPPPLCRLGRRIERGRDLGIWGRIAPQAQQRMPTNKRMRARRYPIIRFYP